MYDPQPQYFDVTAPTPLPPPWWKTWRLMLPIGVALVVVLLVVYGVNWWSVRHTGDAGTQEALTRMDQALLACESDRDPVACKERVRTNAAQNGAGDSACTGIEGNALRSCLSLSARASGSTTACASLSGDDRTACEDLAYFTEGQSETDADICAKIVDRNLQTSCVMRVISDAVTSDACAAAHVDATLCSQAQALRDAIASGDVAQCTALATDGAQEDCRAGIADADGDSDGLTIVQEQAAGTSVNNADTDGDGLSDGDEVLTYHTNPTAADTDQDGYPDGTEVAGGYDPLM